MNSRSRKKVLGAFAVASVGMMASSTAYACTTYKGKVTASGNGAGNTAQTWVGSGNGMNWCTLPTPTVKVTGGNASITLDTAPTTRNKSCFAGQLSSAYSYKVSVTNPGVGYMPQGGGSGDVHNCHGTTGTQVDSGSVASGVFTSATTGTSTVNYTTPSGVGPNSICIYATGAADAIALNMDQV